jgi:hypothetical protein
MVDDAGASDIGQGQVSPRLASPLEPEVDERTPVKGKAQPRAAANRVTRPVDPSGGRPVSRWLRRGLILVSLGLLARMAITHFPEIRHAVSELLTRSWWLVLLAVLLEVLWTVSLGNVYRAALIGFGGDIARRHAVRVSMGAFSLSRILPGGGAAGSVFAAREMIALGNPVPTTVVSMLVSWWVSMFTLALIVGAGTAIGIPGGHVTPAHLIGPALVAGVLVLLGTAVLVAIRRVHLRARIVSGLVGAGSRLGVSASSRDWDQMVTSPIPLPRLLPLLGWAALSWLTDAAALWVMFLGFGVRLHPAVLLVGYGLANLINALPEMTPGWLGVLETALAAAFAALGVPLGVAVVAVLCYRLVSYWLPVAAGAGPALGMLRVRRISRETLAGAELEVAA